MSRRSNAHHRSSHRRHLDRETAFVAALNRQGGNPEALMRAADAVIGSERSIASEHADTISVLTDNLNIAIETYGDAARAVRLWLAAMR